MRVAEATACAYHDDDERIDIVGACRRQDLDASVDGEAPAAEIDAIGRRGGACRKAGIATPMIDAVYALIASGEQPRR